MRNGVKRALTAHTPQAVTVEVSDEHLEDQTG